MNNNAKFFVACALVATMLQLGAVRVGEKRKSISHERELVRPTKTRGDRLRKKTSIDVYLAKKKPKKKPKKISKPFDRATQIGYLRHVPTKLVITSKDRNEAVLVNDHNQQLLVGISDKQPRHEAGDKTGFYLGKFLDKSLRKVRYAYVRQ